MAQQQQTDNNRPTTPPMGFPQTPQYFAGTPNVIIATINTLDQTDAELHLNVAKTYLRHLKNLGQPEYNPQVRLYRFIIDELKEHLYILLNADRESLTSESESSSGGGIPLVALAAMARQFRGHL